MFLHSGRSLFGYPNPTKRLRPGFLTHVQRPCGFGNTVMFRQAHRFVSHVKQWATDEPISFVSSTCYRIRPHIPGMWD